MTVSARGRLRRLWFNVHLWIGIGLGLLLIPLGLTGSALVWGDALLRMDPARAVAGDPRAAQSASAYLAAAHAALPPGARPQTIRWPLHEGDPVEVAARPPGPEQASGPEAGGRPRTVSVFLNPSDARVLSQGARRPGWWTTLHGFHETLLVRGWGRAVVGWLGVAMLVSSLTGIWLWWPRSGAVAKGLKFRRTPGLWLNVHHMAGFWISLPLAFVSLTGVGLGFPQQTRALIAHFAPVSAGRGEGGGERGPATPPHRGSRPHGGGGGGWRPALSPEAAITRAGGPERIAALTLPSRMRPAWRVEYVGGRAVQVDDATGAASPAPRPLGGDVAVRWLHRLHGGADLPLAWRLILTLTGLAPTLLAITGASVWVSRSLRRPRTRAAA